MVDVGHKKHSRRLARAGCEVEFPRAVWEQLAASNWAGAKGSIVQTAIVAGVQASKRTAELIPFCHSLMIEQTEVRIDTSSPGRIQIEAVVTCTGPTGVEMEALTAAAAAALTIYDMCKALSQELRISGLRLLEKTGGKSDYLAASLR